MLLQKVLDQKVKVFKEKNYVKCHPQIRVLVERLNKQGGYLFKEDLKLFFRKYISDSIITLERNNIENIYSYTISDLNKILKNDEIENLSDVSVIYDESKDVFNIKVKSLNSDDNNYLNNLLEMILYSEIEIEERTVIVKFFKRNKLRERFKNGRELKNYLQRFKKFNDMSLISINKFSNIEDIKTPIWIEYRSESNSIEAHYEKYYEFRNGRFVDDMHPERKSIVSVDTYYEYNQIPDLFISEGSKYDLGAIRNFYEFVIL